MKRKNGFILILVIWGVGVMALFAVTFIATSRLRGRATSNLLNSIKVEALSEAGVSLAMMDLTATRITGNTPAYRFKPGAPPFACRMPQGGAIVVSIEDEGGKIDLNGAPLDLLARLLHGSGMERSEAFRLAKSIVAFRSGSLEPIEDSAYQEEGLVAGSKHALFQSTLELEQVIHMPAAIFHKILPFVTVFSKSPGIDKSRASARLLNLLGDNQLDDLSRTGPTMVTDGPVPDEFFVGSNSDAFLIRAEAILPNDVIFVREALVEFSRSNLAPVIREWRRGDILYLNAFEQRYQNIDGLPPC